MRLGLILISSSEIARYQREAAGSRGTEQLSTYCNSRFADCFIPRVTQNRSLTYLREAIINSLTIEDIKPKYSQ